MKFIKKNKKYSMEYMLDTVKDIIDAKSVGEITIEFNYSDGVVRMFVLNYMEENKPRCIAYVTGYYENGMLKPIPASQIISEIESIISEEKIKSIHCSTKMAKN